MISRFARGGVAAALLAAALLTSGCSSTSRDAATISYADEDGDHTVNISLKDFQEQLRVIAADQQTVAELTEGQGTAGAPDSSTIDATIASAWLDKLITYQAAKIEADRIGVKASDDDRAEAEQRFPELTGSAAKTVIEGEALMTALTNTTIDEATSEDAQAFFDLHEPAFSECDGGAVFGLQFADISEAEDVHAQITDMDGDLNAVWQSAGAFFLCVDQLPDDLVDRVEDDLAAKVIGPLSYEGSYLLFGATDFEPTFESLEQNIVTAMSDPSTMVGVHRYLMDVRVNPRYGRWTSVTDSVVPPLVPEPNTAREGPQDASLFAGDATG